MMRQFRSSTGRMWTARVERTDLLRIGRHDPIASGEVLRFASQDGLICDLEDYPVDWERFTERGLLSLLGQAMADWTRRVG